MDIKKLVEEYEILEDKGMTKEEFAKQVSEIISKEFEPIHNKLWQLCKDFHEANPDINTYNISPQLDRDLDFFAQTTGILKDILNGVNRVNGKGLEAKIRKLLGYNG